MTDPEPELASALRQSWRRFLDVYEPLRTPLFRYCRYLTHSPWDAEDLAQDTLARAFTTLGQSGSAPPDPRRWLLRVASNLWIDRVRRRREVALELAPEPTATRDPQASREAAGTLLAELSPQERAAVVLKDVFDLQLDEIAEILSTTVGTVKSALHRGRGRLAEPRTDSPRTPAPTALDAFCAAFAAGDLDQLAAMLLDGAAVHVVGATTQYGREAAKATVLWGMLHGVTRLVDGTGGVPPELVRGALAVRPRLEIREHRGAWIVLHWYAHADCEAVRAITRLELADGMIASLHNYFYNPDLLAEVCDELGVPWRGNGHRFCASDRS